jgi:HTH-type transcriptional regulator/antitoxin HigA
VSSFLFTFSFQRFIRASVNSDQHFRTPGQLVKQLLDERGWSKRVLAIVLGVDESIVNKIVSDRRAVNAETALSLGEAFGVAPERFMDLQTSYELAKARITSRPDPQRATRAALFSELPIAEMIDRGWLEVADIRDLPKVESALLRFFGVNSLEEIEVLPHAAKKTAVATPATPVQLVWIHRVMVLAKDIMVDRRYTEFGVREAIKKLTPLRQSPEGIANVPRILSEAGIRFVIVESLKTAKIDGVCFWLDDLSPVVGMSLRFDRIDNFWFVLRHELEHVLKGHGRFAAVLDAELEKERAGTGPNIPEEERIANEAAANFCVPKQELQKFIVRKAPLFLERDVLGFANTLKVHPGLIAGQLQRHTTRYELLRNHLVKIRSIVTDNAMVDGWGNVAPVDV